MNPGDTAMKLGGHVGCRANIPLDHLIVVLMMDGWDCCQIFLGSPHDMYKRRVLTKEETKNCTVLAVDGGFKLYTHFPYQMNLVKPLSVGQMKGLQQELDTLAPMGGRIVIHPNSPTIKGGPTNKQTDHPKYIKQYTAAIEVMMTNLKQLKYPYPYSLLLEPPAGEGQKIGWSFDQIELIGRRLREEKLPVGFCIDTCHAFSAGLSRFNNIKAVRKFFRRLDCINVLDMVKVVHLNDSELPYRCMRDKHASLCEGCIWDGKEIGLCAFLDQCQLHNIDVICETDGFRGFELCKVGLCD